MVNNKVWQHLQAFRKIIQNKIELLRITRVLKSGNEIPRWISPFRTWVILTSLFAFLFIIIELGLRWHLPPFVSALVTLLDYGVFILFLTDAFLTFYYSFPKSDYLKKNYLDFIIFLPLILNLAPQKAVIGFIVFRNLVILIKSFIRTRKMSRVLLGIRFKTAQIIILSFLGVILVGTILLTFPSATADGKGANIVDALFTATSATCVTGLVVQDTPGYFTRFGQIVILVLIQLGGLGIMTFSAFMALLLKKFTLGQKKMVHEMFEEEKYVVNMIFYIFKMTFCAELTGAALLFLRWYFLFDSPLQALYFSVFHSVSAFCNAGFSLFPDSLARFVSDPVVNVTIMALIITGGLGFLVVYEIISRIKNRSAHISVHTRLVLITTTALILVGMLFIFYFEFDGTMLHLSFPAKLFAAFFQSVTTRTAGFNTIAMGSLTNITMTVIIVLMFIGASPASTGGGIKTSTFAILILSFKSLLKGDDEIRVFKRVIPPSSIIKALSVTIGSMALVFIIFLLLLIVENKPYLSLLFETVSAFGTVGLSTGITASLSIIGKLAIIFLMYMGRIGPLTLGFALAKESKREKIYYPETRVFIG